MEQNLVRTCWFGSGLVPCAEPAPSSGRAQRGAAFASLATLFLVDAVYWRVMPLMDDRLSVTVMDVGQPAASVSVWPRDQIHAQLPSLRRIR